MQAPTPPSPQTPGEGARRKRVRPRHRAEYAALRSVAFIVRRLPVETAGTLLGALFRAAMPFTSRHRRALANIAFAMPHMSETDRERCVRDMWGHLGRVAAEAMVVDRLAADPSRIALPAGLDDLASRVGPGVVVVTAHFGNWELCGVPFSRVGRPVAGAYKALHNPLADRWARGMRGAVFSAGLHAKGPRLALRMLGLLDKGIDVGFVADVRELRGIAVTFFGKPATATPLPAMLARRTGRPLLAGVVRRTQKSQFELEVCEITVPQTDDREADVLAATQAYHDVFEHWIRSAPHQWLWTHRKWRLPQIGH